MNNNFINLNLERTNSSLILSFDNNLNGSKLSVYFDSTPEFTNKKLLLKETKNIIKFTDPLINTRTYFLIEATGFNSEIIAERILPLEGPCNFRDLGGFETSDGRKIKWNKFYRSDILSNLSNNDVLYLSNLKLKKILDYRSKKEAEYEKDTLLENVDYLNISAMPIDENFSGNLDINYLLKNESSGTNSNTNPINFLKSSYESMAFNNSAFKALIKILIEDDERPFVQHCKSGKDRTGIGSAIVLLLLGVPIDKVKEDYLASNIYRKIYNDSYLEKYKVHLNTTEKLEIFKMLMEVREEYFNSTFDKIFEKYNSIENYLFAEFNLDSKAIKIIRDKYLYKLPVL